MPTDLDDLLRDSGAQWRAHVDVIPQRTPATPWWRRRWVAVAAIAACLVALIVPIYRSADVVPVRGGAAGADCAAPHLSIEGVRRGTTAVLHPGEKITLKGRYYVNGCQEYDHEPAPSSMAVTVYLKGHGHSRALAKATGTGAEGRFTTTVRIPRGYPLGQATLQAGPHGKWSTVNVLIVESVTPTQ